MSGTGEDTHGSSSPTQPKLLSGPEVSISVLDPLVFDTSQQPVSLFLSLTENSQTGSFLSGIRKLRIIKIGTL